MNEYSTRRQFLRNSILGLAAANTPHLILSAEAQPTPSTDKNTKEKATSSVLAPTETNIEGPFFRSGAPYRAKITPPLEPGTILLIQGRVWSFKTKKPISGAVLDIWQANSEGRYDNDDPAKPPARGVYRNRARLITDENGLYEFETVHPGHYPLDERRLRPSHIHYRIMHPAHKQLITQLYFSGDPHLEGDPFVKSSLIITLKNVKVGKTSYEQGTFDIVLTPR